MRAILFILIGIALTLGAIYYMGPDRFMELYKGVASTGQEMVSGGGVDTLTKKLNDGDQPAQSPGAEAPAAQTGQPPAGDGAQ